MNNRTKVLFICRRRNDNYGPSFGLINSCRFIANALEKEGVQCKVVTVTDNNDIDREVTKYRPTHVFVEALWVVPEKFEELIPLHPNVEWYVRIHSKIPFLANEGIAIKWLREYHELTDLYIPFHIAANCEEVIEAFDETYGIDVKYFPNIYCPPEYLDYDEEDAHDDHHDDHHEDHNGKKVIDIGCFGAIRPLKNQLNQAFAAMAFGNKLRAKINFHINSDRCEMNGDPILKNLSYAFKDTPHKLILHSWMDHHDFIGLVRKMDLGMQVSLSETFNIVAADFVWHNIPVIGSDEVSWLDRRYKADPSCVESMIDKLNFAYAGKKHNIQEVNQDNLDKYNEKSTKVWLRQL